MRTGVCPKCSSASVRAACNGLMLGQGTYATLMPSIEPGFRGMRQGHNVPGMWQFVCTNCGYLEMFVLDAEALDFVGRTWTPVPPPNPPS